MSRTLLASRDGSFGGLADWWTTDAEGPRVEGPRVDGAVLAERRPPLGDL